MATKFDVVYKLFMGTIKAKLYIKITKEETEADLQTFLLLAIADFKYCKLDLLDFNLESQSWNIDLTLDEISHLVYLMKKQWFKRQIDSDDLLDQNIYSDKDIKVYSQANHLDSLLDGYEVAKEDVRLDKDAYDRIDEDRNARIVAKAGK